MLVETLVSHAKKARMTYAMYSVLSSFTLAQMLRLISTQRQVLFIILLQITLPIYLTSLIVLFSWSAYQ